MYFYYSILLYDIMTIPFCIYVRYILTDLFIITIDKNDRNNHDILLSAHYCPCKNFNNSVITISILLMKKKLHLA